MTTPTITVALDPQVRSRSAVRWAAREASRRRAELRIAPSGDGGAATLAAAADADLLVVAGPAAGVDELVMRAYCPIVIVPEWLPVHGRSRSGAARDPRPVVIGAGPATEPGVIASAFAAAAVRHVGVVAARTWNDPLIDLGYLLSGRLDRWDEADERSRTDLAQQLSLARMAYPEVAVEELVVNERCAERLDALARGARLLVLGRPARGALLNGLAVSPAIALARNPPCPVMIVPPPGAVRRDWRPRRPVGLADLRG